jgi:CheY-like chemotaxis protein
MKRISASAHILVISANPCLAALRKQILQNEGYRVTPMILYEELPDALTSFDAVILGYSVNAKDRVQLSRAIRRRNSEIPILTICSVPGEIDPDATVCISPLEDPERMLGVLRELLRDRRPIEEPV